MAGPRINVTIGANVTPFTRGINTAMMGLKRFIAVGALVQLGRSAIQLGSSLSDMAARTQVSVKWLQEVGFAAQQTGSSLDELTNALFELRRSQAQALGGSKTESGAFAALGISGEDLRRNDATQIFDRIADAVHRSRGGIQEVNAAITVLGRTGRSLVTGMVEGFDGIRERARNLGLVLDQETIDSLDRMGDTIDLLNLKTKIWAAQLLDLLRNLKYSIPLLITFSRLGTSQGLGGFILGGGGIGGMFRGSVEALKAGAAAAGGALKAYEQERGPQGAASTTNPGSHLPTASPLDAARSSSVPTADALQRIGLYAGGGPSAQTTRQQQVNLLRRTVAELQQLRREVQRNTSETKIDW